MIRPDFLSRANATYAGLHQIDENGPYEKWTFKGNQENDYFHKDGIPRRISEVPVDYIDFIKFTKGAPDAKHFIVPGNCDSKCTGCPKSSIFSRK